MRADCAIRHRRLAAQSEQAWCLTLLTDSVVTWTMEYRGLAVAQMRAEGRAVDDDLLAHISPAHSENVNFFGTITVEADTELAKLDPVGHRPLRPRRPDRLGPAVARLRTPRSHVQRLLRQAHKVSTLPTGRAAVAASTASAADAVRCSCRLRWPYGVRPCGLYTASAVATTSTTRAAPDLTARSALSPSSTLPDQVGPTAAREIRPIGPMCISRNRVDRTLITRWLMLIR